ncbi:Phist protein [Plasmodium gonderi]|uniref:Phist protein n=1 Tax=Plasmodium gonderi TaxID=77519 RepID=A0A1Y1JN44_PLAGO|nr:Phist protein [Plasmodium gonderi]GAW83891.1 Phist protein [Plasmodium gonderi]
MKNYEFFCTDTSEWTHKKRNKKGYTKFTFSMYVTILILALLCLFLQVKLKNKCAHGDNTIFESQWRNNGCSRILSETFFEKMKRRNTLHNDRDYIEGHDIENESLYNPSDCSETNLTVFLDDECGSKCESTCELENELECESQYASENDLECESQYASENELECESQYESMREVNQHNNENKEFFSGRKNDNICNKESQQHHYDEKCINYKNTKEEKHQGVHEIHNNVVNEQIPTYDNRFESHQSLTSEYPESEVSFMYNSKNIKSTKDQKTDSAFFRKHKKSYEKSNTGSTISINKTFSLSNEYFNGIFGNLGNMVHNIDILNTFSLYNTQERIKLFNSLKSLMLYWNKLSSSCGISDNYKNKQWLKVYNIVTEILLLKEEMFYKNLGYFFYTTMWPKEEYANFIRKVKLEWDNMNEKVVVGMKEYLDRKARMCKKKSG